MEEKVLGYVSGILKFKISAKVGKISDSTFCRIMFSLRKLFANHFL